MTTKLLLAEVVRLTAGGWAVMIGCIGMVCLLCVSCIILILREPSPSEHHHAPLDIQTRDRDEQG